MAKNTSYQQFMMKWAQKAFDLEDWCMGTISGGVEPERNLINCVVTGADTVEIIYDLPEVWATGMRPGGYHTVDPHKIRSVEYIFGKDGEIVCDGEVFPGRWEEDDWTKDDALEFRKEYEKDLSSFRNLGYFDDGKPEPDRSKPNDPEPIGDIVNRVVNDLRAKSGMDKASSGDYDWPDSLRNKMEHTCGVYRFRLAKNKEDLLKTGRDLHIVMQPYEEKCANKKNAVVLMEDRYSGKPAGAILTDYSGSRINIAVGEGNREFNDQELAAFNLWREQSGAKGVVTEFDRMMRQERITIYDELRQRRDYHLKMDEELTAHGTVTEWKGNRALLAAANKSLEYQEEMFAQEYPGEDLRIIGNHLEDQRRMRELEESAPSDDQVWE